MKFPDISDRSLKKPNKITPHGNNICEVERMNKLKLVAKSHMISKTAPILLTFLLCVSVLIFCGDFSLLTSYLLDITNVNRALSQVSRTTLSMIASVVGLTSLVLLAAPLRLGRERWFMLNAKGEHPKIGELFYYFNFNRYARCLLAWGYSWIVKLSSAAVFFFPSFCLTLVLYYCVFYFSTAFTLIVCLAVTDVILFVIGLGFMFVYNGECLVYYPIIVSNETVRPHQAYSYSKAMTTPVLAKLSVFRLSFAPWWLLCLLVFPSFYVWGYYKQSLAELAYRNEYLN